MSVGVNPPKTPVTKGSQGLATATMPNVCKMPGPPAPFVPAPLPNIGKSGDSPEGYTTKVEIECNPVAFTGATFGSIGDMASKATGGGLVSANTHGPCKFIGPGSMDVKFEGGNVQLLSDPVTNNGGPKASPPNAATMVGIAQLTAAAQNTENANTACPGGGDHEWVQITAAGVKPTQDKINDQLASPRVGTQYEGKAAQHNKVAKSSDLSEGDDLMRMMCNVNGCPFNNNPGGAPEQDHNTPAGDTVEVKSNPSFDERAAQQIGRNFQAVDQGAIGGFVMKYPRGPRWSVAVGRARRVAQGLGRVLQIIRF
jgi:hypothetical protein